MANNRQGLNCLCCSPLHSRPVHGALALALQWGSCSLQRSSTRKLPPIAIDNNYTVLASREQTAGGDICDFGAHLRLSSCRRAETAEHGGEHGESERAAMESHGQTCITPSMPSTRVNAVDAVDRRVNQRNKATCSTQLSWRHEQCQLMQALTCLTLCDRHGSKGRETVILEIHMYFVVHVNTGLCEISLPLIACGVF